LEDIVGKRLAERRPGCFKITEAGHILCQAEGHVSGFISIVMTSHVVSSLCDAPLEKFNVDHPDATYPMSMVDSREMLDLVGQISATFGFACTER